MMNINKTILTMLLLGFCLMSGDALGQQMMSVQVKSGEVRSAPSFLGAIAAKVSYGDRLFVREEKDGWFRVSVPGRNTEGWIHASALTSKIVVLRAGASDVKQAATSDELALAGKGFNKQVEKEFRSKNPRLDFTVIDKMETISIGQSEIQNFLKAGELSPKGGSK
jgi:hypothetical protein